MQSDGRVATAIGTDFVGDGPTDGGDMRAVGAPGDTVELNHPTDLQFLPDGTMLLAAWHNHKIRTFDPATGMVRVVCGSTPGDRDLSSGRISTVAENGKIGATSDAELALRTSFYLQHANENPEPGGSIAFDRQGRLYVCLLYTSPSPRD